MDHNGIYSVAVQVFPFINIFRSFVLFLKKERQLTPDVLKLP